MDRRLLLISTAATLTAMALGLTVAFLLDSGVIGAAVGGVAFLVLVVIAARIY